MDSIASKNSCGQSTKTLGAAKITVAFGARPRKFFETFHSLAVSLLFKSKCERKHEETKLSSPIFLYFLLPTENFPFPRAGAQATSSTHYSSTLAVPSDVPKTLFSRRWWMKLDSKELRVNVACANDAWRVRLGGANGDKFANRAQKYLLNDFQSIFIRASPTSRHQRNTNSHESQPFPTWRVQLNTF